MSSGVFNKIREIGVVPVIRARTAGEAVRAGQAVAAGGIQVLEVTLTVPDATRAISELTQTLGSSVLVGAGTVLSALDVKRCVDAGAQFLVSPGLDRESVLQAERLGCPMIPGALTPSEILDAWRYGAPIVKVFPCSALGGPRYLRSLRGPLPDMRLLPTGGVNLDTVSAYVAAGAYALGVGSELVDSLSLEAGRYDTIEARAREFLQAVAEARRLVGRSHSP